MWTMKRLVLIAALALVPCYGKAKPVAVPVSGTVISVEQIPGCAGWHCTAVRPTTNYVIRVGALDYTLEHMRHRNFVDPPVPLVTANEIVQFSLDGGKHAMLKTTTVEKRLRITSIRTAK